MVIVRIDHGGAVCLAVLVKLTCVEEERINEGAVTEGGAHRCHIVKEAVSKGGVDEGDRLQLHVDESSKDMTVSTCLLIQWQFIFLSMLMLNSNKFWISSCQCKY